MFNNQHSVKNKDCLFKRPYGYVICVDRSWAWGIELMAQYDM